MQNHMIKMHSSDLSAS